MRVVLDTNVLISAFISPRGAPHEALNGWFDGRYRLVTSTWQIEEFRAASRYERVRKRLDAPLVGRFINLMRAHAVVIAKLPTVDLSPDPDDNFIIATAIAGSAHYLVTGDKSDLRVLEKVRSIPVLSAREFVERL